MPTAESLEPGAEPAATPVRHLDYIDGFRGLAITLVLLYHVWEGAHLPAAYWWNPLFSGYTGVNLFLVLSGFCLYWPLVRPGRAAPEPTLAEFARRRAHRLLPPYYIALALCTMAALAFRACGGKWPEGPDGGPTTILRTAAWHVLLVQNLRPEHIFTLDGPLWSLALEVSLYVGMPLLVVLARRHGIGTAVAFAAAATLSYRVACDHLIGGAAGWRADDPETNFVIVDSLPGQWLEFALGMWAASLVGRDSDASRGSAKGPHLPLGPVALVSLLTAAWLSQRFTRYSPFSDGLYGLGYFLLILAASRPVVRGATRHGMVGMLARWRPLVWLGQISYSVYLVHQPLLKVAQAVISLPASHDRLAFGMNLLLVIPIVSLGYLFHLGCEKPFLNGRRKTAAAELRPPA